MPPCVLPLYRLSFRLDGSWYTSNHHTTEGSAKDLTYCNLKSIWYNTDIVTNTTSLRKETTMPATTLRLSTTEHVLLTDLAQSLDYSVQELLKNLIVGLSDALVNANEIPRGKAKDGLSLDWKNGYRSCVQNIVNRDCLPLGPWPSRLDITHVSNVQ